MLLFFWILKRLDVTQATLSNYALPFFMGLLAVLVLGEKLTMLVIAGGILVFLSTLVVTVYEGQILDWLKEEDGQRGVKEECQICEADVRP